MLIPCVIAVSLLPAAGPDGLTPEARAVAFLAREVPAWSPANKCFSCHNNGDAARALYQARRRSYRVPAAALADTTRWLAAPQKWDHNGGEGPFSDKVLARIQFAAALVEAKDAGAIKDHVALLRAAELLAEHQQKSGAWQAETEELVGSPVTYGTCLATYFARRTLERADAKRYRAAIARADAWLRKVEVKTVLDAAAVLLALAGATDPDAAAQRQRCLGLIRKGEAKGGGWGPYVNAAPEAFDTAVVLLALSRQEGREKLQPMITRGRAFLVSTQRKEGDWPATTRPPGAESYAQRLSTTGWATQALLATASKK
jgi:hypothetical protein